MGRVALLAVRATELALADLRLDYVKAFAAAGYKFSTSDLMSLRFAGVTAAALSVGLGIITWFMLMLARSFSGSAVAAAG